MSAATTHEMSCQELVEVITGYLEGAMSASDVARFESHLEGCDACRAYLAQMRETIAALGHLPPESLSPGRRERARRLRGWRRAAAGPRPARPRFRARRRPGVSIRRRSPGPKLAGGLRGQRLAVQQVSARQRRRRRRRAPRGAWRRRSVIRVNAHRLERLDLAHDPVAARDGARRRRCRAAPTSSRTRTGKLGLERLDRGVEGVRHRDVDRARPVGVGTGALAAADRLVVGAALAGEGQVVHRPLALGGRGDRPRRARRTRGRRPGSRSRRCRPRPRPGGARSAGIPGARSPRSAGTRRPRAARRGRSARGPRRTRPTWSPRAGS